MNPRWHDEFLSLCALFPAGELTDEEWALLQIHLSYCNSCFAAFREYESLAQDVSPLIAASARIDYDYDEAGDTFSLERAERELMRELARSSGLLNTLSRLKTFSPMGLSLLAAGLVGVAYLIGLGFHQAKTAPGKANARIPVVGTKLLAGG